MAAPDAESWETVSVYGLKVAGLVFGEDAARGEIAAQLSALMGERWTAAARLEALMATAAMDSATRNAGDMIKKQTITYNRTTYVNRSAKLARGVAA